MSLAVVNPYRLAVSCASGAVHSAALGWACAATTAPPGSDQCTRSIIVGEDAVVKRIFLGSAALRSRAWLCLHEPGCSLSLVL